MEIKEIFDNLSDKITQLSLYQRAISKMAEGELNNLNEYYKSIEDKPELLELPLTLDRMCFPDAKTGELRTFGRKKSSIEDRMKAVVSHKNKQYQWLLAEAYEAFEDFIEDAYAYAALLDKNLWPLRDFGNISLSELSNKDFTWLRCQVDKIKNKNNILNQFKKVFKDIESIEVKNKLDKNLKLTIILIENLRHIIVHNSGIVDNIDDFIKSVLDKAGLYNNGNPSKEYVDFIKKYFGSLEQENKITLLEVRIQLDHPINIYFDRLDSLISSLMSYSFIVIECLQEHKKG